MIWHWLTLRARSDDALVRLRQQIETPPSRADDEDLAAVGWDAGSEMDAFRAAM